MKPTDKHIKTPYINAAKFFSFLLAAFVLFVIIVPKSMPSGFGDGNGPGVFGTGSGNGTGDGHGDGSQSGNSAGQTGKGENPDAKNTEYNPGKGDGKGDGEPPPPPEQNTEKNDGSDDEQPEQNKGNQQTAVAKKRNLNLPVAQLYLDPNKDDENKKPVKKVVKKVVTKKAKKTAPARKTKMSDVGRGTGGGSRKFSSASGGRSVFRIQKHKNILFIVDISGSMNTPASEGQTRLSILQFQLKRTIQEQYRIGSKGKYGIIAFCHQMFYFPEKEKSGQYQFSNSKHVSKMEKWVDSLSAMGGTFLFTAIQNGLERIRQQGLEIDTIFILTDGEPGDESNPDKYLKLLKENLPYGIVINTISIGRSSDLLKVIAQNYNGAYDEYK